MTELERALVALGHELEFPPTPELASRVRARVERPSRRRLLVFAVAALAVAVGIAMAVPPARSAILRFFHIGAVTVEQVETLPRASERPLTAGFGPPLSRRRAEIEAHLAIRLPDVQGPPPTRYYAKPGMIATLLSVDGKPVLLAEMRDDQVSITKKETAPGTKVEPADVGQFGLWIEGRRHVLRWQFGLGDMTQIETRLAGNVLIWLHGSTTYRLEGDLSRSQMLALARQITR